MTVMIDFNLKNIDPEDLNDLLVKVEKSFDIQFLDNELSVNMTFGEFCDCIINKIQLVDAEDCTTQQAFYKLRISMAATLPVDINTIAPDTLLEDLLPRKNRISRIRSIEEHLGFKLSILGPPHFITISLVLILLASIITVFFNQQMGLSGLIFSIGGLWLAFKTGKELDLKTVGQLAEKMTQENYLKSRRNSKSYNKKEIEKVLIEWFSREYHIATNKLTRDAKFV